MARKRIHLTTDILGDALHRLGIAASAVDREALRVRMGLPEQDGFVEDAAVAAALRDGEARRAFAGTGVAALKLTVPALRVEPARDGALAWRLRVSLPLLDDGRLDLRLDVPPGEAASEILEEMALGNDPAWRLADLRAALAEASAGVARTLHRTVARLRDQVRDDLHEIGADAPTYIAHLEPVAARPRSSRPRRTSPTRSSTP